MRSGGREPDNRAGDWGPDKSNSPLTEDIEIWYRPGIEIYPQI